MEISFSTIPGNLRLDTGYGYAGYNMIKSLQALGHTVPFDSPRSQVQLHFSQPDWYRFHKGQYMIGYTPWESSVVPDKWVPRMNACDEIWTPAPICAEWFKANGVERDIHIYPHGINPFFAPRPRQVRNKLKFLHVGEPAPRKGGQLALDAFRAAFGDKDDVQLTLKCFLQNNTRAYAGGMIIGGPDIYNNVKLDVGSVSTEELVRLYHSHHALVYPSWGEGFGLIPLEAMATGMPAVVTKGWAIYEDYALGIESKIDASPWPMIHPGNMFKPSFESLVEWYRMVYNDYERYAVNAYVQSHEIHKEYDWLTLTENAFDHIVKKFSDS